MPAPTFLLTGGTGYIGSHAAVRLLARGYRVVLLDNLSNSSADVVDAIAALAGVRPEFYLGDIRDRDLLRTLFGREDIAAVVHFAGRKSVGESVADPFGYYDNNVAGSLALFETMREHGCGNIVFSSSATVYRGDGTPPFAEDAPLGTANPYGTTKLVTEKILEDLAHHSGWRAVTLRYFNPVGAHPSGLIGERPAGTPNNLLPYVMDVAAGRRAAVTVYGADYPTPDGTGVRDYLHVEDLAEAHVAAVERAFAMESPACETYNVGTGRGTSVLEMIALAERACARPIPYEIAPRRPGDIAAVWCDPARAERTLGWRARLGVDEAVRDAWNFARRGLVPPDDPGILASDQRAT